MAYDVYLIGLWDDSMMYWLVDQAEWDKLDRRNMQVMNFTPFITWDLLETLMSPEEFEQYKVETGSDPLIGSIEDSFTLDQILDLVKTGKINVLDTAEGLQL